MSRHLARPTQTTLGALAVVGSLSVAAAAPQRLSDLDALLRRGLHGGPALGQGNTDGATSCAPEWRATFGARSRP